MIYFDNAATTYPKPEEVYVALDKANRNAFNAGRGEYSASTDAFNLIEETRTKVAKFIGASGHDVVFTSSATESLNTIINGINIEDGDYVYVSPFEHNAVIRPLRNLQKTVNFELVVLPFDKNTWEPKLDQIENLFVLNKPKAVFISHISNVTGYIVPFENIFSLAVKYGSINVLDCAQSYGVVNPDVRDVSYVIFAGHKSLYASFGIAGFIKLKNDELKVVKAGGTGSDSLNPEMPKQIPYRYEAGSPNIVAIAGLNASIKWINNQNLFDVEWPIYKYLLEQLGSIDSINLYLPRDNRVFGVVSLNIQGYKADEVATILNDDYDISARSGFHCAPFVHDFIGSTEYSGTVRISLSAFSTIKEIDSLVHALREVANEL